MDLAGIESVGETYGEVDVEKLAALRIELVVTAYDPRQDGPVFGFVDGPVQGQVEAIAPIVALDGIRDPIDVIARYEELAASLGADLQAPGVAAARQDYEDAAAELTGALAEKPGLLAVAVYATPSDGVTFFGDTVSLELADKYPADLILFDSRYEPADMARRRDLGRTVRRSGRPDRAVPRLESWSYQAYAGDVRLITIAVRTADPDLA